MKTAGVMIIKHVLTGYFYIIKSNHIQSRAVLHKLRLTYGTHLVTELQKLFDIDPNVKFEIHPAKSPADAGRIEESFLKMEQMNRRCLNFEWVRREALTHAIKLAKRRKVVRKKPEEETDEDE